MSEMKSRIQATYDDLDLVEVIKAGIALVPYLIGRLLGLVVRALSWIVSAIITGYRDGRHGVEQT